MARESNKKADMAGTAHKEGKARLSGDAPTSPIDQYHDLPSFTTLSQVSSRNSGILYQRSPSFGTSVSPRNSCKGSSPESSRRKPLSDHLVMEPERHAQLNMGVPSGDVMLDNIGASVPTTDDPSLSIDTPRMWFLSLVFALVGSATNLLFSLRYPSVTLTPMIALLVAHPAGLLWDRVFKRSGDELYSIGSSTTTPTSPYASTGSDSPILSRLQPSPRGLRLRLRLWLAQGEWNRKEHTCVFVSSNVSFIFAFATDVIVEQVKFYKTEASPLYQVLLVLSTQLLGYSVAGLVQDFLVKPSTMVWPNTLMATSMLSTLHNNDDKPARGWKITRWSFFVRIASGSFAWYFLPGLLAPALSYFNIITWAAPDNRVIANLFGVSSGLGMFPMTFDWSQIAYTFSPLITSFSAAMNVFASLVLIMWFLAPILYYTNAFSSSYLPILSSSVYDNQGQIYNISRILTPDLAFDPEAYHAYSPVYLPITYALSYAVQFASMTAVVSHTACWQGIDLTRQFRRLSPRLWTGIDHSPANRGEAIDDIRRGSLPSDPLTPLIGSGDIHGRLMSRYEEVPILWYLLIGLSTTFVAMGVVQYYSIGLPWWSILIALAICTVLIIPIGLIMGTTNIQISIYLASQIAAGFLFPGRGLANIIFVTYAYITSTQALKFAADLKLGHYMKVPPRILFKVQVVSTSVTALAQVGVLNWALKNIQGICTPQAVNGFTCPMARVHFNGSVLWGVIGPARFFGPGALYSSLNWAFLVGAVGPILFWLLARRDGSSRIWSLINLPVFFGSLSWIPPATGLNFSVWALVCFIFNFVVYRRYREWHNKYNLILSSALDAGTAVSVLVIFFAIVYWGFAEGLSWWGTEIYKQGCDWNACSYRTLSPGETFGSDTWS